MAWTISNAMMKAYENSHSLLERAAESLVGTCSDGEQSQQSNTTPMPDQYYWPDKTTEHSRLSRFGMTCEPLTESHGEDLLTWFRAGFPARTSVQQEKAPDLRESAAACGVNLQGSLARYDHEASLWRTAQCSLIEGLDEFSETWPRWGMTQNGASYLLPTPVHLTLENVSGLWQTPVADDSVNRAKGKWNSRGEPKLSAQVMNWPTPNASDANKWSNQSLVERNMKGQQVRLNTAISPEGGKGGVMNPGWVEWLMGWPINWTSLKPLGRIDYILWEVINGKTTERTGSEGLRSMWWSNDPASMEQWEIRLNVQESQILLAALHKKPQIDSACEEFCKWEEAGAAYVSTSTLRGLLKPKITEAPSGWEPDQQCSTKHKVSLPTMPCGGACSGGNLGKKESATGDEMHSMCSDFYANKVAGQTMQESSMFKRVGPPISRTAMGIENRSDRLKAIGNGQVALCAAAAWRLLA